MTDDGWKKQADRLRELARDRGVATYLLGWFLEGASAAELADLVEACLVYRERFGASGNDRRQAPTPLVAHHCGHCARCQMKDAQGRCCMEWMRRS